MSEKLDKAAGEYAKTIAASNRKHRVRALATQQLQHARNLGDGGPAYLETQALKGEDEKEASAVARVELGKNEGRQDKKGKGLNTK